MATTRIKFEFLLDAAMYYGSVRVGDVEIVFDKEQYSCSYIAEDGIFPFIYEDGLCRYLAMIYWDEMADKLKFLIESLAVKFKDFVYETEGLKVSFIGYEVYVDGELISKPSGIPGIYVGKDIFDAEFILEELYCGLGFGILIDIVVKLQEFVSVMEVEVQK